MSIYSQDIFQLNQSLHMLAKFLPGHIYWKDTNGAFLGCNMIQAQSAGLTVEEMIGKTDYDMPWKAQAKALREADISIMKHGLPTFIEENSLLSDGEMHFFLSNKVPLFDKQGKCIGILGISLDITAQKHRERALEKQISENKIALDTIRETEHKLDGMTAVSVSIAHELRTPLASLELATSNLEKYLPILVESYRLAQSADLPIHFIPPQKINLFKDTLIRMRAEIRSAFMFIDMLLIKLKTSISARSVETFTMSHCIGEVLNRYPFQSGEKKLVSVIINHDFIVQGAELLITHVFFNLIKNALHHMAKVNKGEITILLDADNKYNKVKFRDTGSGIPKDVVPKVFQRFFSKTHHGAGVGLTFCKTVMKSLRGNIICDSEEGQYTEFVLFFPKQGSS